MLSERLAHHIELDRAIYHTQHDTRSGIDVSQFLSCRFMYAVDGRPSHSSLSSITLLFIRIIEHASVAVQTDIPRETILWFCARSSMRTNNFKKNCAQTASTPTLPGITGQSLTVCLLAWTLIQFPIVITTLLFINSVKMLLWDTEQLSKTEPFFSYYAANM